MTKLAAFGTALKKGATTIAQVMSISGPGLSLDTEDLTSHDSTGAWEEHVGTILRSGEVTFKIAYDPAGATHKNAAGGLLYDLAARVANTYSIVFPGPVTWSFSALITGFEPDAPVEGGLTANCKMKLTGQPTLA